MEISPKDIITIREGAKLDDEYYTGGGLRPVTPDDRFDPAHIVIINGVPSLPARLYGNTAEKATVRHVKPGIEAVRRKFLEDHREITTERLTPEATRAIATATEILAQAKPNPDQQPISLVSPARPFSRRSLTISAKHPNARQIVGPGSKSGHS